MSWYYGSANCEYPTVKYDPLKIKYKQNPKIFYYGRIKTT